MAVGEDDAPPHLAVTLIISTVSVVIPERAEACPADTTSLADVCIIGRPESRPLSADTDGPRSREARPGRQVRARFPRGAASARGYGYGRETCL